MPIRSRASRGLLGLWRNETGITIVELTVASGLLMVLLSFVGVFLNQSQKSEKVSSEAVQQQQSARVALERVSRSLREAGYPDGETYSTAAIFDSASDYSATFYGDPNNNGINDRISYYLDTTTNEFKRTTTIPDCSASPCSYDSPGATTSTYPIITGVRNASPGECGSARPVFTYSKRDRGSGALTQITNPSQVGQLIDINYVAVTLLLDVTPGGPPTCNTLTTTVSLRNWRG